MVLVQNLMFQKNYLANILKKDKFTVSELFTIKSSNGAEEWRYQVFLKFLVSTRKKIGM